MIYTYDRDGGLGLVAEAHFAALRLNTRGVTEIHDDLRRGGTLSSWEADSSLAFPQRIAGAAVTSLAGVEIIA